MPRLLTAITRRLRLDADEPTVHFHGAGFWDDEPPEICFDPDCQRPRVRPR